MNRALDIDSGNALDDITCGIIHYRQPRELLIVSGPPVVTENDAEMAAIAHKFNGVKIICGGTTAKLIGRELKQLIVLDYKSRHCALPPRSSMKGFALVTEGIITLHEVARFLQSSLNPVDAPSSPAREIVELFLDCDVIRFLIGTRINEAWQDPTLPSDLGLRRTIVSQIARLLEEKFHKETRVQFL